ncbi:putative nuclease HARBI1 [Cucumis melo var. makuwa]|uniref:Putative nuclease HARBI1 n=1 Tax=Cucumis melo var. makuwa TaxID=1194695 RepID=A0A5D3BP98_CUCMM|nr:putative nuclease HARBI1 [Cucumis melo var. makuwa]
MFLYVLAHDVKNRVIQREFVRSGGTISRYLNLVLLAVYVQLMYAYLFKPTELSWGVGRNVHKGYYYLCDTGYPNAEEFLAPYRGKRYQLQEWHGTGNAPTTTNNMKHSSARNVIERSFVLLKGRWAIIRGKSMATSSRAPKHVWMKEKEDTLVECLVELSHLATKSLLNKPFYYYDELAYVFERDRATGRFIETFVDIGSNEHAEYEGFDMSDGNDMKFPSMYSQGIDMSQDDVRASRPAHVSDGEMPDLSNLDRVLCQRQLMRSMDNMHGFVEMTNKERKNFCRVFLRDVSR